MHTQTLRILLDDLLICLLHFVHRSFNNLLLLHLLDLNSDSSTNDEYLRNIVAASLHRFLLTNLIHLRNLFRILHAGLYVLEMEMRKSNFSQESS